MAAQESKPQPRINPVGQRFGSLYCESIHPERDKFKAIQFVFKCDCGNTIILTASRVIKNSRKSCGCKPGKFYVTSEAVKQQIVKDSYDIPGSMTYKAKRLSLKYDIGVEAIQAIIRPYIPKIKRLLTEQDREQIKALYSLESGIIQHHKFKGVAEKTGFSISAVRMIIKAQEREETKYFNPRMEMF